MAKQDKVFTIKTTRRSTFGNAPARENFATGTLEELVNSFGYTLDCGRSYQHEKGNKKINCNPKSIKSLVSNLNNAKTNSAANGYSGYTYEHVEP